MNGQDEHSDQNDCCGERRKRLMIADDDFVARNMLTMSLDADFVIVGTAADSDEAINLARTERPDAALVDVEMPKGGGLAAVRGILDVSPATAIVMLSSDDEASVVLELLRSGAMVYRRKGVSPDVLVASLHAAIRTHANERHPTPSHRAA